jgi:Flp pilus assembly protein TadD
MRAALLLLMLALPCTVAPARAMDSGPSSGPAKDADADNGRKAIEARDWKAAIENFNRAAAREPRNAEFQNLLGFAWRKSGNLDLAFKHYNEALRLDTKHRGAHEYIGEAYLMINNVAKAEEHLGALDQLCRLPCAEYTDLKKAVEDYKRTRK